MNEGQAKSFGKIIKHDANEAFDAFIEEEVTAQPDNEGFLRGVQESEFFKGVFLRGFMEGIKWGKKHEGDKFVLSEEIRDE